MSDDFDDVAARRANLDDEDDFDDDTCDGDPNDCPCDSCRWWRAQDAAGPDPTDHAQDDDLPMEDCGRPHDGHCEHLMTPGQVSEHRRIAAIGARADRELARMHLADHGGDGVPF